MSALAIPEPTDVVTGWFDTTAAPWIDQARPDELVAAWQTAVVRDDVLDRIGQQSVDLRRAIRWAERRIGVELGDSKRGPRQVPEAFRNLDSQQRSAFRKMAKVDAGVFRDRLAGTDDRADLSRAGMARWADRQAKAAEEADARVAAFDGTVADAEGTGWKMLHGDFRERLRELEPGSVDLILTDPPYPADFLPLWSDLAEVAAEVLRPQGLLVAMTGKIYFGDVFRSLERHLDYGWIYAQPMPGSHSRILARQVLQAWKPWVAFSNGKWPSGRIDWHADLLEAGVRTKDRYRWEQDPGPAHLLVDCLSAPGDLVVDPFAGTGAYGTVAQDLDRRFIGVELDAERFQMASDRLRADQ